MLLLFFAGNAELSGQLQSPGKPVGINTYMKAAEAMYVLAPPDPMEIEAELELNRRSNSKPLRFALERSVNLSPETHGSWSLDGDIRVWRVHILSPGAYSLGLVFGRYALQPGVKLFVYDPGQEEVKGAFTSLNNKASGVFPVGHLAGEELVVEMQVPATLPEYGELELRSISHAFLNTGFKSSVADCPAGDFGCSEPCHIDVNCEEGDPWSRVKSSVVRIVTSRFYCTGVLVNNTDYDGTPYILTAEHCINRQEYAEASVFLFNYESPSCFGEDGPKDMSIASADLITHGDSVDFSLVELSALPPASFGAYYAGWDRSTVFQTSTATIHHPYGDVKKVSIDEDMPSIPAQQSEVPYQGLQDYHYYSFWWIKRWEVGSTEGGSSGAPLFNQAQRVIGSLSGGVAACGDSIGYDSETDRVIYNLAPNYDDFFAQFAVAWDHEQALGNALQPWLGPDNPDVESLGGYDPSSSDPVSISSGKLFQVFPNPAHDRFFITSKGPLNRPGNYSIFNLSGVLLEKGLLDSDGRAEIHTGRLSPGIYLIQVGTDGHQEHHKLLVSGQ